MPKMKIQLPKEELEEIEFLKSQKGQIKEIFPQATRFMPYPTPLKKEGKESDKL